MTDPLASAIRTYILDAFLPGADASELTDDMSLISSGILDSLATVRLVAWLEEQYHVEIAAHEATADHLDSVDQIVQLLREKLAA